MPLSYSVIILWPVNNECLYLWTFPNRCFWALHNIHSLELTLAELVRIVLPAWKTRISIHFLWAVCRPRPSVHTTTINHSSHQISGRCASPKRRHTYSKWGLVPVQAGQKQIRVVKMSYSEKNSYSAIDCLSLQRPTAHNQLQETIPPNCSKPQAGRQSERLLLPFWEALIHISHQHNRTTCIHTL